MREIIGSFYFKTTIGGNLIGEFTNMRSESVSTESADLLPSIGALDLPFVGDYLSTWRDQNGSILSQLNISAQSENNGKFNLLWLQGTTPIFEGQGFLVDGLLIGHYMSMD